MQLYFAIYNVWEQKCNRVLLFTMCGSKNAMYFAIYNVWEQKCKYILLFAGCGSQNQKLISLNIPNCSRNQYDLSEYYL